MADRPSISLEPNGYVTTAHAEPSGLPPQASANPEATGAVVVRDDLDTTFEKVRASGAEVLQEPTSQPWGARDCAFRDPSGNLVRIAQA